VRRQCDVNGDCTVIDQEIVRVVIDYAPWGAAPGRGQLGINTEYCEGKTQCPDWLNDLNASRSNTGDGNTDVVYVARKISKTNE